MASEIRVNKIINRSGLSTVTFTSDGAIVSGIVSATVYTGSGANLTDLPAGNLSGTLPAISAANLTNVPAANITGTLPAISAANLTNVPAANITGTLPAIDGSNLTGVGASFGNSSVNTSGIITATAFVPTTQGSLSHRNIAINGAMTIAQRGTSSTASNGFHTVDRWSQNHGSTDEAPTFSTFSVDPPGQYHLPTTGPHPYKEGFRQAWGVTNGNQTSGAGADDNIIMGYAFEAQDIATCGWDYTNPNSFITLSFWVKSSVAQEFYGQLLTQDGTIYNYPFGTGALTAFTWKKVVKTIPGNANITFNNDNGSGLRFYLWPFAGTNLTGAITNDAWMVNNYSTRVYNNTTTWYTTNDASLQITGFQLEVGSVATPFEHRTRTEELQRCRRYFQRFSAYGDHQHFGVARAESNTARTGIVVPVPMRALPTVACNGSRTFRGDGGYNSESTSTPSVTYSGSGAWVSDSNIYTVDFPGHSLNHNQMYCLMSKTTSTNALTLDSEF